LGDASNVWAIGAIIMRLMNTDKDPGQPNYDEDVTGMMEPQLNRDARREYSTYLCHLMDRCVRFRTYNRIALPELWTRIKRYTGETIPGYDPDEDGDDEDRFDELQRNIREQMDGDGNDESRLQYPEEKYKIGTPGINDEGQGNEEQGDEGLDDYNQFGGGSYGEDGHEFDLDGGAMKKFLKDDLGGKNLGDANLGGATVYYPAGRKPIDDDFDYGDDDD
jgi:hypothetical protein